MSNSTSKNEVQEEVDACLSRLNDLDYSLAKSNKELDERWNRIDQAVKPLVNVLGKHISQNTDTYRLKRSLEKFFEKTVDPKKPPFLAGYSAGLVMYGCLCTAISRYKYSLAAEIAKIDVEMFGDKPIIGFAANAYISGSEKEVIAERLISALSEMIAPFIREGKSVRKLFHASEYFISLLLISMEWERLNRREVEKSNGWLPLYCLLDYSEPELHGLVEEYSGAIKHTDMDLALGASGKEKGYGSIFEILVKRRRNWQPRKTHHNG